MKLDRDRAAIHILGLNACVGPGAGFLDVGHAQAAVESADPFVLGDAVAAICHVEAVILGHHSQGATAENLDCGRAEETGGHAGWPPEVGRTVRADGFVQGQCGCTRVEGIVFQAEGRAAATGILHLQRTVVAVVLATCGGGVEEVGRSAFRPVAARQIGGGNSPAAVGDAGEGVDHDGQRLTGGGRDPGRSQKSPVVPVLAEVGSRNALPPTCRNCIGLGCGAAIAVPTVIDGDCDAGALAAGVLNEQLAGLRPIGIQRRPLLEEEGHIDRRSRGRFAGIGRGQIAPAAVGSL